MDVSSAPLYAFFGLPGHFELLIVGLVGLLLFGHRLPTAMRSLGMSITELKRGIRGEPERE